MKTYALANSRAAFGWLAGITLGYMLCLLALNRGFAIDEHISGMFFDFTCHSKNARQCWLLDKSDRTLTFFLHDLPIHIYTAVGVLAFTVAAAGFKYKNLRPYRELAILTVVALICVPGIVAGLKIYSGHYCPGQMAAYGGPIGTQNLHQPKPRCFPAGSPAAGFSLIVLYFGGLPSFWKRAGLYGGLGLGVISSIIQLARGEHFLSHCIATLVTALFIGLLVAFLRDYKQGRYYALIGS